MLSGLFGSTSLTSQLRGGLEEVSATHQSIADRVAGTLAQSSSVNFANALNASTAKAGVDQARLEQDMASLADTQIRYEADARLLQQAYARLRTAIRDHA